MQSIVLYGRLLARAVVSGINDEFRHQWSWSNSTSQQPSTNFAKDLHLVTASSGISKTGHSTAQIRKKWSFGDDACFIARQKKTDVLGVADGVGGWRSYGVDPSVFPYSLMMTCQRLVKEGHFQSQAPKNIISDGYYELLENKAPMLGSCTACVVALHQEEKTLYTANLGDSGFLVIRNGKVVHRSEEQQHYFNAPFQLAVAPKTLRGLVHSDSPESAVSTSFGVKEGDIVLVGTDGLFDNLSEDMILHHVSKLKDSQLENVQTVANSIAHQANELAFDPEYVSPFALSAAANGFGDVQGGKPDDITVLLAKVAELEMER